MLSIAEADHMAQPGFGKAKMQLLKPGDRVRQASAPYDADLKPCVVADPTALTASQKHGPNPQKSHKSRIDELIAG